MASTLRARRPSAIGRTGDSDVVREAGSAGSPHPGGGGTSGPGRPPSWSSVIAQRDGACGPARTAPTLRSRCRVVASVSNSTIRRAERTTSTSDELGACSPGLHRPRADVAKEVATLRPPCPTLSARDKKAPLCRAFSCAEEDSNLHPVSLDQALNLVGRSVDPSRSCRSVQIVWSRGRYGRIRRSGRCHGCCHAATRQTSGRRRKRWPPGRSTRAGHRHPEERQSQARRLASSTRQVSAGLLRLADGAGARRPATGRPRTPAPRPVRA